MDDFQAQLKFIFLEEAEQMLSECEASFLDLEERPEDSSVIDGIFRVAHSFKGSASVAGFDDLSQLAHHLENLLSRIKMRLQRVDRPTVNILLRANDQLKNMVSALKADPGRRFDQSDFIEEINRLAQQSTDTADSSDKGFQIFSDEEIATSTRPAPQKEASQVPAPSALPAHHAEESIRVNLKRLDELVTEVGELVILQAVLFEHRHLIPSDLLQRTISHLEKVTRKIQDSSMSLRMVPLTQTFQKMQRIVRDASHSLGKNMRLKTIGEDTEIDKTILDRLGDPLIHLVRNAADHGIESPEERRARGKPEEGTLTLRAFHSGENIVVEICDDGRGLDATRLIAKAEALGLIPEGSIKCEADAYQLIFMPGFSTKAEVTSLSGRGVGMNVVKTHVEDMKGRIEIETQLGQGSCFRIFLPLTMAIVDGMTVSVAANYFLVPLASVHESLRPGPGDISHVAAKGNFLNVRGETMQIFSLACMLGLRSSAEASEGSTAIVIKGRLGAAFAILVDEIVAQQQIVIKRLGEEIQGLPGITGAAILGDGRPALIVDPAELVPYHQNKRKNEMKEAA